MKGDTRVVETGTVDLNAERTEIKLGEMCDVCGRVVDDPNDAVRAELTASGAMCPSAMTFHQACYERASSMWQPDPESYCTVDPLFPETGQWNQAQAESEGA